MSLQRTNLEASITTIDINHIKPICIAQPYINDSDPLYGDFIRDVYTLCHVNNRQVIVKRVKNDNVDVEQAKSMALVHHDHVVALHGLFYTPLQKDCVFFVIDVHTTDLGSIVYDVTQPYVVGTALAWMYQALCGLEHLHSCGITHRRLNLSNILLVNTNFVKLSDFLTKSDKHCNTIEDLIYVDPILFGSYDESLKLVSYCWKSGDVYSMAMCIWEIVTRRIPYDDTIPLGDALIDIMNNHRRPLSCSSRFDITPSSSAFEIEWWNKLDAIINKAWSSIADTRQTATQLKNEVYDLWPKDDSFCNLFDL
jgi:serine/threonine protein kinase